MTEILDFMNNVSKDILYIKTFIQELQNAKSQSITDKWIDGQEVMLTLHISKRTLQTLRDTNVLPFSRVNGKFYYKVADIDKLLESNYSSLNPIGRVK
jgi:hypothetical protein